MAHPQRIALATAALNLAEVILILDGFWPTLGCSLFLAPVFVIMRFAETERVVLVSTAFD
jgi:hypothetical protein